MSGWHGGCRYSRSAVRTCAGYARRRTERKIRAAREDSKALLELVQREFAIQFRIQQRQEDLRCPYVFTLTPRGKQILWQEMELKLYCHAPGEWHPISGNTREMGAQYGRYVIPRPEEWLLEIGRHVENVAKILKYVIPIVGPWLGPFVQGDYVDQFRQDVELMGQMTEQLWQLGKEIENPVGAEWVRGERERYRPEASHGASLRALRNLLVKVDPDQTWGGLAPVLTPEGHWLWLCPYHAAAYK